MKSSELLGLLFLFWLVSPGRTSSPAPSSAPSSPAPAPPSPPRQLGTSGWTRQDMQNAVAELAPLGIPLEAVLLVMAAESNLNPHANNGSSFGLLQAQAPLLRAVGWTQQPPAAFAQLSVSGQLPWIRRMLQHQIAENGYVPSGSTELFRMNLSPLASRNRSIVLYSIEEPTQRAAYDANKRLDVDGDGKIDVLDLGAELARVATTPTYQSAQALLRDVEKGPR